MFWLMITGILKENVDKNEHLNAEEYCCQLHLVKQHTVKLCGYKYQY
jgi:hypothetical protein